MSMGYGELEAEDNAKPKTKALPRKTISLKLKREAQEPPKEEEYGSPKKKEKQEEEKAQDEELKWNFKVKLAAEKKTNILNICEKCKKPILVHGRLIPCKHFLCLSCAQNGTRTCYKCTKEIIGIQPVPTIYICTSEGTRHSVQGCRKSYLNLRGLAQHQQLRHSNRAGDPSVDSDGELSVSQQTQQATPVPAPATLQQHPAPPIQPALASSLPAPPSLSRPMLLPSLSTVTSTSIFTTQNATQSSHIVQAQRCQIPISAAPPMSVISMPRANLPYPTPVSVAQMSVSSVNQQTLLPNRSLVAPHQIMSQVMSPLNLPGMLPRPEFKQFSQVSLLPHLKPPFHPGTLNTPPPGFPHMPSNIADMMPPPPPPAPQQVQQIVQSPRDPRKMARDIPPPPPPKNGSVR